MAKLVAIYSGLVSLIYKVPVMVPLWDFGTSWCSSFLRFGLGAFTTDVSKSSRPNLPLKLYEFEACPFCRKVRETISILDLNVIIYPCPRETMKQYGFSKDSRFRPVAEKLGGKLQFPFLVDDNTGKLIYESDVINKYLWETYGQGGFLASAFRPLPHMGILRTPSKEPQQLLVLYGYEAHPNSRLVREALCSLELPYTHHSVAIGSSKRNLTPIKEAGLPYFMDPNTNFKSWNTREILNYLQKTYKTGDTVQETWSDYSTKGASASHGTLGSKKTN